MLYTWDSLNRNDSILGLDRKYTGLCDSKLMNPIIRIMKHSLTTDSYSHLT